ncbi:MAG: pyrimidine-nucleoside phosphorylase [Myxococcales bacterium]
MGRRARRVFGEVRHGQAISARRRRGKRRAPRPAPGDPRATPSALTAAAALSDLAPAMRAYDLIRKKRDGGALDAAELRFLARGAADGTVADEQLSAFLMAVFFRGMEERVELPAWLDAMLHSGQVLDLSGIPGRKVDKHSTGGVGDKISLPLAPLVAVCGVKVPMVSGRGLGHTGGTLDKLESIPGFRTDLPVSRFTALVERLGLCLIGQTAEIAPADRKLYALRDATATVESVPLIASSILSKKLAEGIDALVLDVKVGRGAFMRDLPQARVLARTMVDLCRALGRGCTALLTAMDAPLGAAVGNAVEVAESIEVLRGGGPADVRELTLLLGIEMLVAGEAPGLRGLAPGPAQQTAARALLEEALSSGSALERFAALVEAQGGDARCVADPGRLPRPALVREVRASRSGFVRALDAGEVGLAAVELGAGRARKEDAVDAAAGLLLRRRVGDEVRAGDVLAELHARDADRLDRGEAHLRAAAVLGDSPPPTARLLLERVG